MVKLYVGNIPYQTTEEELRTLFVEAGTVESAKIVTDSYTGASKGFGFVEMSTQEEAQRAITMFNGYTLKERKLVVDIARPRREMRDQDPRRGGRSPGPRSDRT